MHGGRGWADPRGLEVRDGPKYIVDHCALPRGGWIGRRLSQTDSRPSERSPAGSTARACSHNRRCLTFTQAVNAVQGPIRIHSIDLGTSAPQFSNREMTETIGRIVRCKFSLMLDARLTLLRPQMELGLNYTDTAFILLSPTVLFNYPFPGFVKLPPSIISL